MAALADGIRLGYSRRRRIGRLIKAKKFLQNDPEIFALYASLGIVTLCATIIGYVLPVSLLPLLLPCMPLVVRVLAGRALGCFHRRG